MKNQLKILTNKHKDKATLDAAEWQFCLRSGRMNPEDRLNFNRWLSAHPGHQRELDVMDAIWERFNGLKDHPLVSEELEANKAEPGLLSRLMSRRPRLLIGMPRLRLLGVITVVFFVVAAGWLFHSQDLLTLTGPKIYRTVTGEQRTVAFPDGSTVVMDTDSCISALFSETERRVKLSAGRALFSVEVDPQRPFIVSVNEAEIRVLGTEFDVAKREDGKLTVAVLKGRVEVIPNVEIPVSEPLVKRENFPVAMEPNAKSAEKPQVFKVLTPGEQIVVNSLENAFEINEADIAKINDWRAGKLDFDNMPLEDVIAEVNRYLSRKIIIEDDELKQKRLSIVFFIRDSNYFLSTLKKTLPVATYPTAENRIVLKKING